MCDTVRALLKPNHYLNGRKIFVKACDSWHQPNASEASGSHSSNKMDAEDSNTEKGISILHLNDDCLETICKKLELQDQLRFARVCGRFKDIFEMCSRMHHKVFIIDSLEKLTLWESREFFQIVGQHIEEISGKPPAKNRVRLLEFVAQFCPKVTRLSLYFKLKASVLNNLLSKMQQVTELELKDCSLHDNTIAAIRKLPKLQKLSLAENYELTGKDLDKLNTVEDLNIYSCPNIQPIHFISLCKSMKNLKSLDMRRCDRLNTAAFEEMVKSCKNLSSLKITCNHRADYECVAKLEKLTKLEMVTTSPHQTLRNQLFKALAEHKANQLEYFKVLAYNWLNNERAMQISQINSLKYLFISYNNNLNDECLRKFGNLENLEEIVMFMCPSITNDGVLSLLRNCAKLQKVCVQTNNNINDNLLFSAIDIIKQRHQKFKNEGLPIPKNPVQLFVAKTAMNSFIVHVSFFY